MFKRFLEPRSGNRPKSLGDLTKFMDDRWLAKTAEKEMAEYETDELCPSMYSFHSSPDEKNRLLYTLADCGIETNVDRLQKKNRIKDWIESSIITEEDEVGSEKVLLMALNSKCFGFLFCRKRTRRRTPRRHPRPSHANQCLDTSPPYASHNSRPSRRKLRAH